MISPSKVYTWCTRTIFSAKWWKDHWWIPFVFLGFILLRLMGGSSPVVRLSKKINKAKKLRGIELNVKIFQLNWLKWNLNLFNMNKNARNSSRKILIIKENYNQERKILVSFKKSIKEWQSWVLEIRAPY